jgi:uncharacterized YigZ family protein
MRYLIPQKQSRAEIKVKNSRFIATLDYCPTAAKAKEIIAKMRQEMPGANHHVYAFKAGHGASVVEGMSDDGEPGGTSGPPVMAVLRGSGVGDAIIVVTRFFGGTKLGTGGLVSAYKKAAQEVMAQAVLVEKVAWAKVRLKLDYAHLEAVRRRLDEFEASEDFAEYGGEVELGLLIPEERVPDFSLMITGLTAGKTTVRTDG